MNSVNIFGYIARDPEFRYTQNGICIMSFTVAVNDRIKRGEQWEDIAHFVNCSLFGNRAKALEGKLTKSCAVCVSGKLRQQIWQDENGQNKSKLDVVALDLNVCKWAGEQTKSAAYAPQMQPDYARHPSSYTDGYIPVTQPVIRKDDASIPF